VIRPGPSSAKNAATGCRFTTEVRGIPGIGAGREVYFLSEDGEDEAGELLLSEEVAGFVSPPDDSEPDFFSLFSPEPDFSSDFAGPLFFA
ncbi:MAG TPA: hypothetical protein VG345_13100, partial [Bryobacteraceae bacterium]|nr:hypothetical protein [Bryobacteraceae bacterium]